MGKISSFITGAAIGVAAALLLAPKTGEQTRALVTEKANSISDAIDDLFDQVPSVDSMAEKMNDALDQMGSNLKKFSDEMDKQLNDLSDQLTGSDQKPPEQDQ